eukprot:SAG11_NODE_1589_length_4627_cov_56.352837_1_plen_72_part_00
MQSYYKIWGDLIKFSDLLKFSTTACSAIILTVLLGCVSVLRTATTFVRNQLVRNQYHYNTRTYIHVRLLHT